jgi:hypothetical protein
MRYKTRAIVALCGAAALVAVAVSLAFASAGRAASTNICNSPSTGTPLSGASCVTELVAPHFISPGNDAFSVTKFVNESSNGGATATHLVLSVAFSSGVTVKSIQLAVNGVAAGTSLCTTSATSVSCPAGNLSGGGTAKLTVRFNVSSTTTSSSISLTGSASYGEGGGNPSNPPNDFQVNYDTLTISSAASGGCFDLTGTGTQTVTGATNAQSTSATVGAGAGSLPCTFADAGVKSSSFSALSGAHTQISFVEFPTFASGGYAIVRIFLTPIPSGFNLNNSPIFEDTNYAAPYFTTFITVPNCDKNGNIIGPVGTPPKGATNPSPVNDSCIFNRSQKTNEIDLHVAGSPFDGSYQG